MTTSDIRALRLQNLQVTEHLFKTPVSLLRHMGAMQAQDYQQSLWAVGSRLPGITLAQVEQAITDRQILRTWPMRGTIHFVPAEDAKWMVRLMAPRVISAQAARRRQLNLTDELVDSYSPVVQEILAGNKILTRKELLQLLESRGIEVANQRGIHILWELAARGLLCFGPYKDKQPTFVLLDEWAPTSRDLNHEESLREITLRYFTSHGPATIKDFATWTRLPVKDIKATLAGLDGKLERIEANGQEYWLAKRRKIISVPSPDVHLLSGFEEYMLGYKDRSAMLELANANKVVPGGNGVFFPIIVIDGQIRGTWKRTHTAKKTTITLQPFAKMTLKEQTAARLAGQRYGDFIGRTTELVISR
jgi:hypothetical protein